jgi:hypothetical protein
MLDSPDRFAFKPTRIHAFRTTGNAYDAVQCDDSVQNGDILLILDEGVVGLAHTWPMAITAQSGHLHAIAPDAHATLAAIAADFAFEIDALDYAIRLAGALGFPLCPATAAHVAA